MIRCINNLIFKQTRIGQYGRPYILYKFRSIPVGKTEPNFLGRVLRKTKLDELPQLFNFLKGEMNLVGPRPDVPGYADLLQGDDRMILSVKPGITGLASLKYRNEEAVLAQQPNPQYYNDAVIWPDKVRINCWYVQNRSWQLDLLILFYTLFPLPFAVDDFMSQWNKKRSGTYFNDTK
jgi:lipopolysaccharide/colanic/teichoic acid biosynthesis glycosyltransferase